MGSRALTLGSRPSETAPRRLYRVYSTGHRDPEGRVVWSDRTLPSHDTLELACGAFARGTLISTESGPRAIEDLVPGERIITSTGRGRIDWIGSLMWSPNHVEGLPKPRPLTRLLVSQAKATALFPDLLLGPGAQLYVDRPDLGAVGLFAKPAKALHPDVVLSVMPQSPVQLFHIAVRTHGWILANGVKCAAFHPDLLDANLERPRSLPDIFPHMSSLSEFGSLAAPKAP